MKPTRRNKLKYLVFAAAFASAIPAKAITIVPEYDASFTSQANFADLQTTVNNSIAVYSSRFSDSISIKITFKLDAGTSGASSSWSASQYDYSDYLNRLTARSSGNTTDTTVLAHLGAGPNDPVLNNSKITVAEALAVTMGLAGATAPTSYGTVSFNLNDYKTNPVGFLATIQHEVNEVLGMGSNLPNASTPGTPLSAPGTIMPSDQFRYTSGGARSFTTVDTKVFMRLSPSGPNVQQFNNIPNGGDYGDYYTESDRLFGMSPNDQSGSATDNVPNMTASPNTSEIVLLDAIGYNLTAVPEPSAYAAAFGGLSLAFGMWRRRGASKSSVVTVA